MKNADYFSNYVTEDFTTYINRKRKNNCHGNHIEMQAMAEMYNRPVEVYQYTTGESAPANRKPSCCSAAPSELTPPNAPPPRGLSFHRANQHIPRHPPEQRRANQSELPPQHPLQLGGESQQGHDRGRTWAARLQTRGTDSTLRTFYWGLPEHCGNCSSARYIKMAVLLKPAKGN